MLIPGENEIPTEREICQRRRLDDHPGDVSDPGKRHRSKRASVGNRGREPRTRRRTNRCLNDWLLNPQQFADRRPHQTKRTAHLGAQPIFQTTAAARPLT